MATTDRSKPRRFAVPGLPSFREDEESYVFMWLGNSRSASPNAMGRPPHMSGRSQIPRTSHCGLRIGGGVGIGVGSGRTGGIRPTAGA
jgi:hypothetical protein